MKKWSPHPKQQPRSTPLSDKYHTSQFIQSFLNILPLSQQTCQLGECLHTIPISMGTQRLRRPKILKESILTKQDEETEYQNYLKEYETVLKNSRKKVDSPFQTKNKEMEKLISQFLEGMQENNEEQTSKRIEIETNRQKKQLCKDNIKDNVLVEREEGGCSGVKIHKIDLSSQKRGNNKKSTVDKKSVEKKSVETPLKRINLQKYQQRKISSRLSNNIHSTDSQKSTSPSNLKVSVIRIDQSKKKQLNKMPLKQGSQSQKNKISSPQGYSIAHSQKQSYKKDLKKTIKQHQTSNLRKSFRKNQQFAVDEEKLHKDNNNTKVEIDKQLRQPEKPIKIEIEIPLDEMQTNEQNKSFEVQQQLELERQEIAIVRQIEEKVCSLIRKMGKCNKTK